MTAASSGPSKAMVLAAGRGIRMRPITDTLPKPLVRVLDRTLIDRALDRLQDDGVAEAVVNVHHLANKIRQHLKKRAAPTIIFSEEEELLETGGGVNKALPLLGKDPFYVINADTLWLDGVQPTLKRLRDGWDGETMDGLLLLHPTVEAHGYKGIGDFLLDPLGRVIRRPEREVSPYLFAGVQILHPKLFDGAPRGPFSLNRLYDAAIEAGRLFGQLHDGEWFHVGTPDGLAQAEAYMQNRYAYGEAKRK